MHRACGARGACGEFRAPCSPLSARVHPTCTLLDLPPPTAAGAARERRPRSAHAHDARHPRDNAHIHHCDPAAHRTAPGACTSAPPPRTSPTFSRREHDVQPTISTLRFFYSCDVRQGRSGWTNAPTHGLAKQLADARADGRRASARKHSLMPSKNPLAADRADGRGAAMGDLISRNLHSLWA